MSTCRRSWHWLRPCGFGIDILSSFNITGQKHWDLRICQWCKVNWHVWRLLRSATCSGVIHVFCCVSQAMVQDCYVTLTVLYLCMHFYVKLLSVHNGHFPGEPGLVSVYWSKGLWSWWVTTAATDRAKLQSNHHHQQTNIQFFYRPDALPVAQPTVSNTEGKISHSMDLLTPSSTGGLSTLSLTTNSCWLPWGGLPCLTSALWCQYPAFYVKLTM